MPAIAVIGAQWGDEGKGKVVDLVAERADVIVRFSGGDNAGHTVINKFGKFALHLIPSGIFSQKAISIIGNGAVVNPEVLFGEIEMLKSRGIDTSPSRLMISNRTHVIMPYHLVLDELEESLRGVRAIGTTKKGIGPVYADKIARQGIRMGDLLDKDNLHEVISSMVQQKNILLTKVFGKEPLSSEKIYRQYAEYGERLAPYICDTTAVLQQALKEGKVVMLEGAQGTLLDPDFGTYPYATSSSPLAAGACLGSGIGPRNLSKVLGVYKAYCTRVGGGPFPTELKDSTGDLIRERAHEYGTTTGRPRRCGWFDGVAGRFAHRVNGFTGMAITRFDILDVVKSIKICTAYKIDGKLVNDFPASIRTLEECEPVYEELPGWVTSTCDVRNYKDLPANAKKYIRRLEQVVGCPASMISVGPERSQTIEKKIVI